MVDFELNPQTLLRLGGDLQFDNAGLKSGTVTVTLGHKLDDSVSLLLEAGAISERTAVGLSPGFLLGAGLQIDQQPLVLTIRLVGGEPKVSVGMPIPLQFPTPDRGKQQLSDEGP